MTRFFALTTRGLEDISQQEIASLANVSAITAEYRRIAFEKRGAVDELLTLKTVDDIFIDVATWAGVVHTRNALDLLKNASAGLELWTYLDVIEQIRALPAELIFSVTASFIGKRNYTSDEIKLAVAEGISASHGWQYSADVRESHLNVRLFILHEIAYVGLRLGTNALHERAYKQVERAGSLKATVAVAMLRLADLREGKKLLDPCCGAGTILLEGAAITSDLLGGDIDSHAISATSQNADFPLNLARWDVRTLPLANASIDCVVTNLPWGRQISVDDALARFYADACAEIERVLNPDGCAVILTSLPEYVTFSELQLDSDTEISVYGQQPHILKFSF